MLKGTSLVMVKEGVSMFENGELAWHRTIINSDGVKGAGPSYIYGTTTFQDGSTITGYTKGTSGTGPIEITVEIIHGTGRFQGIKGTVVLTSKNLPPEKEKKWESQLAKVLYTSLFTSSNIWGQP